MLHLWFPRDQLLLWLEMFNSRLSESAHTLIARENNFNAKIMFRKANGRVFLIIIIMPRFLCQFVSLTFKEAGPGHKIIPESLWEALSFFLEGIKITPLDFLQHTQRVQRILYR